MPFFKLVESDTQSDPSRALCRRIHIPITISQPSVQGFKQLLASRRGDCMEFFGCLNRHVVVHHLSLEPRFLGIEVALIGLVGYVVLFGLALASLQPGLAAKRWPVQLLAVLSGGAVLFTAYLKFLEFFVIHAICRWCVASAVIIATVFVLSLLEVRALPSKA